MRPIFFATYLAQPLNHRFFVGLAKKNLANSRLERVFVYVPPIFPPLSRLKEPKKFLRNLVSKIRTYYLNKHTFSSLISLFPHVNKISFYRNVKDIYPIFSRATFDETGLFVFWAGQIVSEEIYKNKKFISIMYHSGALPEYRGSDTLFWQLKNGEKKVGCSIALLNDPVDSGDIILQDFINIDLDASPLERLKKATKETNDKGVDLTIEVICDFDADGLLVGIPQPKDESKKIYKSPTQQELKDYFLDVPDTGRSA